MLIFQDIKATGSDRKLSISRAKVPGGWLVLLAWSDIQGSSSTMTFVPDANHQWDGASLP
jgi:hypothetical protein